MVGGIDIALSGLKAAETKLDVTANNVANVLSDKFKKSRTINQAQAEGGVSTTVERVDSPGLSGPADPITGEPRELSNVDLGEEMLDMIVGQRTFEANLKTVQTQDEMLGTIINLKA